MSVAVPGAGPAPVGPGAPRPPAPVGGGAAAPPARPGGDARASVRRPGARHAPVGIGGLVLVALGAAAQLVALTGSRWVAGSTSHGGTSALRFSDFGPAAHRGFAYMYFTWGAWVLLAATLGLGVAACLSWAGAGVSRALGTLVGGLAAFAPPAALVVYAHQSSSPVLQLARNYGVGPYLATLGVVLAALGAAAGCPRVRRR